MGELNLNTNGKIHGHTEFQGRVTKSNHPYMLRSPNTSRTVPHNTHVLMQDFGTTRVNQGGIGYSTSDGKITFPTTGLFRINCKVNLINEGFLGNDHQFYPKKNGTDYPHSQLYYQSQPNIGAQRWYTPSYLDICIDIDNANDYVQLYFYQNSYNSETLHGSFGYLEVYLIG
tara:strand:- start:225 stop:740 length:516 start_codon:yes stop_codon:yes gene_type:complete